MRYHDAKILLTAVTVACLLSLPAAAQARVSFGIGVGVPCCAPAYYPAYYAYSADPHYSFGYPPPDAYPPVPEPLPAPAYSEDQGYCREYNRTIMIDGRPSRGYGTACMQPDGSWKLMN